MRLFNIESFIVLAALVLATGCGQNPHVTSGDEAATATESNASAATNPNTNGDENGNGTNSTDPNGNQTAGNGATGPSGAVGPSGATGPSGELASNNPNGNNTDSNSNTNTNGNSNTSTNVTTIKETNKETIKEGNTYIIVLHEQIQVPVPTPVVVAQPTPPPVDACWKNQNPTQDFRGLNPDEIQTHRDNKGAALPYLMSSPKNAYGTAKTAVLDVVNVNAGNQGTSADPFVNNAIVLMETDLYLPPRDALIEDAAFDLTISLNLHRRDVEVSNYYDDTEMLCLLDMKKCSGTLFHADGGFYNLINEKYFGKKPQEYSKVLLNDFYSKQMQTAIKSQSSVVAERREWTGSLTLKLSDLLAATGKKISKHDLIEAVYGLPEQPSGARKLRLFVSDDSMVRSASVQLNYTIDGCKAGQK